MKKLIALCALLITAPAMAHDWGSQIEEGYLKWGNFPTGRCNSTQSCYPVNMRNAAREWLEANICNITPPLLQECAFDVGDYVEAHRARYQPGMWGGYGSYVGERHYLFRIGYLPTVGDVILYINEHEISSNVCGSGHEHPGSIPWYGPGGGL